MNELVKEALSKLHRHQDSPFVFCNLKGKTYADVRKSFFTACKKSGIINFRFHDLRHTFASHLVMKGVDLATVKKLMGHSDIETTMIYSHLAQDHLSDVVSKLDF